MSASIPTSILGIESSCDDTAVAIWKDNKILANLSAGQEIHEQYGGVVPELASRAHQQHIIPLLDSALKQCDLQWSDFDAIACTRGPGLLGSLLVGTSLAKALSLSTGLPLIGVHHMKAHVLAHFIDAPCPEFPFLCLTVSGGHTQIVQVDSPLDMKVLGQTLDDAAGEAFDKIGKLLGLGYPAGPVLDKLASKGNPMAFDFARSRMNYLDLSFSGLKTSVLYFLKKQPENFVEEHINDLCASVQQAIIEMLLEKLERAAEQTGIRQLALAGGVSANSGLRQQFSELAQRNSWEAFIPAFEYCTDNAAMIARAGAFIFEAGKLDDLDMSTEPRLSWS
jgi:N6-L-threonylcarbamoyladenine synthase